MKQKLTALVACLALAAACHANDFLFTGSTSSGSISITNTYQGKMRVEGVINTWAVGTTTNNVIGKVVRTTGSLITTNVIFASGTTTNTSGSIAVNEKNWIAPGEVLTITNSYTTSESGISVSINVGR